MKISQLTRPFIIQLILVVCSVFLAIVINPLILFVLIVPFYINLMNIRLFEQGSKPFYFLKIYRVTSSHGRFYILIKKDRFVLFQDKVFYLKIINSYFFSGDENIEQMNRWVQKEISFRSKKASI